MQAASFSGEKQQYNGVRMIMNFSVKKMKWKLFVGRSSALATVYSTLFILFYFHFRFVK